MEIAKGSIYANLGEALFCSTPGQRCDERGKCHDINTVCAVCGGTKETVQRSILYRKGLYPAVAQGDFDLVQALGFKGSDVKNRLWESGYHKTRVIGLCS